MKHVKVQLRPSLLLYQGGGVRLKPASLNLLQRKDVLKAVTRRLRMESEYSEQIEASPHRPQVLPLSGIIS